ncbi:MAG TPA: endonuclease/exonuclease/phosphatase family protein [Rhizomicrobium sp.]|nr:endonuclease/exonuclease/phosphatase family protein [Rhizomicrobium sp.]
MGFAIAAALLLLALYVGAVIWINRNYRARAQHLRFHSGRSASPAGGELSVLTWNLGYAGLGEESDFLADGGTHLLPPSRRIVLKNIGGITDTLKGVDADVYIFQEVARSGLLTYWVNVKSRLESVFRGMSRSFHADTLTRLVPHPLRLTHGTEIFSRHALEDVETWPLPGEADAFFGIMRKSYNVHVARLNTAAGARWTIMNIHLAAFDHEAIARKQQLAKLLAFASREYENGGHVVIGGDWNLMLAGTEFPATADPRHRFWLHPMPANATDAGWRFAVDPSLPTVRTDERPYTKGVNATAIIDGFLVSPNVEVVSIRTENLEFRYSDHQPVLGRFVMRP